jgi:hypothetical protein
MSSRTFAGEAALLILLTAIVKTLGLVSSLAYADDARVTITPDALDFTALGVNTSMVDTVGFTNVGIDTLLVSAISLDHPAFALSPTPLTASDIHISAGTTLYIPIAFSPQMTSEYVGDLEVLVGDVLCVVPVLGRGVAESIVINEILADPPSGEDGDANRDGGRHSSEDEFVEILNVTRYELDISDYTLSDRGAKLSARFAFPAGTRIQAGERIVLFGGGSPSGLPGQVFVDDGKIGGGLTNSGDAVYLISASGDTVASADYGKEAGADQSITRHPDGSGPFVRHRSPPGVSRFSPGALRVPLASILKTEDTLQITLGQTFVPAVVGLSAELDTIDIQSEVTWSTDPAEALLWESDSFVAALPGSALVRAHFDTVSSEPLLVRISLPDTYDLRPVHSDTVALLGTDFAIGALLQTNGRELDITPVLAWQNPDSSLAAEIGIGRYRATEVGSGRFHAMVESRIVEVSYTIAEPGDFDLDQALTSADAVRLIHIALGRPPDPKPYEWMGADSNEDGSVDVVDLVDLVDRVLGRPNSKPVPSVVAWEQTGTTLTIQGPRVRALIVEFSGTGKISSSESNCYGAKNLWVALADSVTGVTRLRVKGRVSEVYAMGDYGPVVARQLVAPEHLRVFPNPFNAKTTFEFALRSEMRVEMTIYSALGQQIVSLVSDWKDAGAYRLSWDGTDSYRRPVGSGVYVARLKTVDRTEMVRMVLLQ